MADARIASNVEWKRWGEVDPLYGVATGDGKAKGGPSPWTDDEFYTSGKVPWDEFLSHWERYGLDKDCCVEIGCGAGRLTMHMARSFRTIRALDVSEGMIAYAQARIGAANVTFHLTDGLHMPLPDGSVTAVFSTHVFQHFDSVDHAAAYFAEVARVLKPGGTLMVHLPIHRWPVMGKVFDAIYRSRKIAGDLVARIRRLLLRLGLARPLMRWRSYSVDYLLDTLPRVGLTDVELWIFCPNRDNKDPHPFVLARRTK